MCSEPSSEVYPHAPLIEAVFEIRFPGEPAVECQRDEFFEMVRDQFPRVHVPKVTSGQWPSLLPYHFRTDDEQNVRVRHTGDGFRCRRCVIDDLRIAHLMAG